MPTTVTLGGTLFADLLRKTPDIDAVFCVNDDLALGVLFECQRRQISVPDDMAIVGFNDLEFMASAVPSLTSVRTNRYEMGRHAVTMVIDAIEGRRPQEPVVDLGFQLMVRAKLDRREARLSAAGLRDRITCRQKMVALSFERELRSNRSRRSGRQPRLQRMKFLSMVQALPRIKPSKVCSAGGTNEKQ